MQTPRDPRLNEGKSVDKLRVGMRREEVLTLRWDRVETETLSFLVEETKTGVPLELPITRQLADVLKRRRAASDNLPNGLRDWVFPSRTSATDHVQDLHHVYRCISGAGATASPVQTRPSTATASFRTSGRRRIRLLLFTSARAMTRPPAPGLQSSPPRQCRPCGRLRLVCRGSRQTDWRDRLKHQDEHRDELLRSSGYR